MRILRLRLKNYRGIADRELVFERNGVTVVEGPNEIGKSSLAEALDFVLDELDSTTKRKVKAIQPVDRDVGPEIEVDLETGPYAFTYFKRFFKDRETVLRLTRPHTETLTGRDAHERVRAILNETIDEHLWRVLRIRQGAAAGPAPLADAASLTRALDRTAGSGAVREGESTLFQAVRDECGRYFTDNGKLKKALRKIVDDDERATVAVTERERRLTELEDDAARSTRLARDLEEKKRALRESEELADRRAADVRRIEELQRKVEAQRVQLALEETKESVARREQASRDGLRRRLEDATGERVALEEAVTQREPTLKHAAAAAERAHAAVEEQRRGAQAAEELFQLRVQDFEYNRDKLDLDQLVERRAHVEQARAEEVEARALLDRTRVKKEILAEIRACNLDVERAEAQLEAAGPSLKIEALRDLTAEFAGEQVELEKGQTLDGPFEDKRVLRIPDVVELTVSPGASIDALTAARDRATTKLRERLATAGVADLAAAERAELERQHADEAIARSRVTIETNLRDLTVETLDEKIARLRAWVDRYPERRPPHPPPLEDFEAAVEAKRLAKHAFEDAREGIERAAANDDEAAAAIEKLMTLVREQRSALQHTKREEHRAKVELAEARAEKGDEEIAAVLAEAERRRRAEEQAFARTQRDLDRNSVATARELLTNAQRTVDRMTRELEQRRKEHHMLAARLETLGERGLFHEQEEARTHLAHARRRRKRMEARAAAAKLLFETMRDEREAARRSYVGPLRERITELGRLVFGDSFTVELDQGLRVTSRTLDGVPLPLSHLSVGAQEQLAIVSRLACALLVDPEEGVPLIFDDTLGHTDPERLEGMGATLRRAGEHCQIIVLTCTPGRFRHIGDANVIRL